MTNLREDVDVNVPFRKQVLLPECTQAQKQCQRYGQGSLYRCIAQENAKPIVIVLVFLRPCSKMTIQERCSLFVIARVDDVTAPSVKW